MKTRFRVVKVGGSLFELPDLPARIRTWLAAQEAACTVLLAGGGAVVEEIRRADRRFGLSANRAHRLAIQGMGLNAGLLGALLPEAVMVVDFAEVFRREGTALFILEPEAVLQREASLPAASRLPASWDVTSDSIAAWIARQLGGAALVLLKSAEAPSRVLATLAGAGYVDAYFPIAAHGLSQIEFVDVRGWRES